MLNKFHFQGVYIANQSVLSLYGLGKNIGLIVDMGHDITRIIPVYDSYILEEGSKYSTLAGKTLNKYINEDQLIKYNDNTLHKLKRKKFKNRSKTHNKWSKYDNIFINPLIIDLDSDSIVKLILQGIELSPIDLRKELSENIMLVGGTSSISGLCKKLTTELRKVNHNCKVYAYKNRNIASWIGGSILSCLPTFNNMWISK
jgi:actin-related protein